MTGVSVVASGAVTAVGVSARATWAAVRAGVSGVRRDNIWDKTGADWMSVARPQLRQWWEGPDMLAELSAPAVWECLAALPGRVDPASVPVILLLEPEDRPGHLADLSRIVLGGLAQRLRNGLSPSSRVLAGRTGLLGAVRAAAQWFQSGHGRHVVVCGVDTFLRQRVVDAFVSRRRVLNAHNSNGFIPGEAACAVLLTPDGERPGAMRILGAGGGRETGTIDGDSPCTGRGLTRALRTALEQGGLGMAETGCWLNDQNGEHYKAKECTIAQIRLERRARPAEQPYQVWHPIEYLGEMGSAVGPCLLGLAHAATCGGWMPSRHALMSVGEDNGDRAGFVLLAEEKGG